MGKNAKHILLEFFVWFLLFFLLFKSFIFFAFWLNNMTPQEKGEVLSKN